MAAPTPATPSSRVTPDATGSAWRAEDGNRSQRVFDNAMTAQLALQAELAASARGPAQPNQDRRKGISDWVEKRSDRSGDFFGIGGTSGVDKVKDALRGQSELGPLNAEEQRFLLDRVLDRWTAGRGEGICGTVQLSRSLDDAPQLRGVVGERLAIRAAELWRAARVAGGVDETWQQGAAASSIAMAAVTALSEPPGGGQDVLRSVISALDPRDAGSFARALAGDRQNPILGYGGSAMSQVLESLGDAPMSDATSAFVQNAFAGTSSFDYASRPALRQMMAGALAREWYPGDSNRQAQERERLAGILDTRQGRELLGITDRNVPLEARVGALAAIRTDSAITGQSLGEVDDPWTAPAIVAPFAQESAGRYLATRGDAPLALRGSDLDNTVGYAMGLRPSVAPGADFTELQAAAARGEHSFYASGEDGEAVRAVADQICAIAADGNAQVTVLPITYSSNETGPVQLPLFRVLEPAGQERFVDNIGRRYDSFEDWRTNNQLPSGSVTYPADGHLRTSADGRVALGHGNTPRTVDTLGEHITEFVDKAALVGGIVAGGVLIVGSGGLATPIVAGAAGVAVGAGAWGAYRSGDALLDRARHGQSLDPIHDEEARGLWLNLGASAASVGAFGSAARLAQLGRAGRAIAPLEASAHGYVQAGAAFLDSAAIANQGVDLSRNWSRMSAGDRVEALLSMGFWATATAVGARGGMRPGDIYNPVRIRDNLLRDLAPPVTPDPALPGNAVSIDYDPATGAALRIRHGLQASAEDIDLHVRTAQNIQRSLTLEGQLRSLFTEHGEPPPGTVGWAARLDIAKLRERMQSRASERADPQLTAARCTELAQADAIDARHIDELSEEVASFVRDPARATIDARSTPRVERDTAAERQALHIGETSRSLGRNEATWTVNERHETVRVRFHLREIPPKKERPAEENELTSNVGKEGGRTGEFPKRDDGGHMIGFQFMHDQGLINLFPQNSEFNQHVYNQFETEMRQWIEAGGEVRGTVEVGSAGANGGLAWAGARPSEVAIRYEVVNPRTGRVVYRNQTLFDNEQGQRYRGFESEAGAGGRQLAAAMRARLRDER
ncbi:DUF4781 domain-containing protein [Bradyrhizobium sp. Arg237L]|uniref:DUF4781 domain-containing protein n=1 Tax=Bradyrhizobium sp. Arg237L TaxID=3003352 RepID=UPI00249E6694|nr:DUF4781 domain-containing protein [Bradyrhizobium sp. Arg237L]MDI4231943.1 DUF4781 domain-containing protein [Bradyrhizobium sp. Arg237L]